ncbi:MAG: thermonuclease family protein [Bacteriovoracia bacterium]
MTVVSKGVVPRRFDYGRVMRTYLFFLPLACLFFSRELFTFAPVTEPVKISEVLDGDTLLLATGARLRLAAIDAPELGQPTIFGGLDAGVLSRSCLEHLLAKAPRWRLQRQGTDIYGRVLGDLTAPGIASLNRALIEAGCVSLYAFAEGDQRENWRARERAMRGRIGLWKFGGFMRPAVWRRLKKKGPQTRAPWRKKSRS